MHHIGDGFFISSASDKLAELVREVKETGKTGKIELIIRIKKSTRGGAMHITGDIKLTKPKSDPMEAMLFVDDNDELTPDNPHQHSLDLKVVADTSTKTLKQINQD